MLLTLSFTLLWQRDRECNFNNDFHLESSYNSVQFKYGTLPKTKSYKYLWQISLSPFHEQRGQSSLHTHLLYRLSSTLKNQRCWWWPCPCVWYISGWRRWGSLPLTAKLFTPVLPSSFWRQPVKHQRVRQRSRLEKVCDSQIKAETQDMILNQALTEAKKVGKKRKRSYK